MCENLLYLSTKSSNICGEGFSIIDISFDILPTHDNLEMQNPWCSFRALIYSEILLADENLHLFWAHK